MAQPNWVTRGGKSLSAMHPCFSIGRKNGKGRIHLPVSPGCNLGCRFCSRVKNSWEERPGVTEHVITPEEALETVRRALALSPDLTVVGIAGPGDALATPYALDTFRLVKAEFPHLILCLSTNGLLLPEKAREILAVGVDTLTVTVNDIDPERLTRLCAGIVYHGKALSGPEAMKILIQNQLEGISQAAGLGIIVKVNTVLVPRVNGVFIADIARTVADAGAGLYNIIPLIPQHELSEEPLPLCGEIAAARTAAQKYIEVFQHCQHCRADAIGVPGETDLRDKIGLKYAASLETFSHG